MIINKDSLLASAISYLPRFSIIPVGQDKKPLIKWKEFQSRKPTLEEVKQWCELPGITGIAIVTGKISGLTVLDVEAGIDILTLDIPNTPTVKTGGGGYHFYFSNTGNDFNNFARFREKMDIRGGGGYVIAPPSLHPSGGQYLWDKSLDTPIATMPQWLINELKEKPLEKGKGLQSIGEGVQQGQRNEAAAQYVGGLLTGIPMWQWENDVWPQLKTWNFKCRPPLPEEELRSVYDSISKREAGKVQSEEPPIDVSQFKPMSLDDLSKTLSLTIKKDEENKIVTFLCELTAYTENAQFNISYNAPSSTGKSYIPMEIAQLFPQEDVREMAYCSPTAFFHDVGVYDKERNSYFIDLSRKILIFLDQPHTQLLERLRPFLSHDKKEILSKITDKTQKYGMKTKSVIIRGFPSVIFCTAGLKIDEQESSRFLLLSPEVDQEKINQAIRAKVRKESDNDKYKEWLESDDPRRILKDRIKAIKQAGIKNIKICSEDIINERFLKKDKILKPRHQRDISRLMSLIKAIALLNLWWREKEETTITANEEDINIAFKIWDKIAVSQELNIPPYIFNLYREVIIPSWHEKNNASGQIAPQGITRQEILQKHYQVYARMLDSAQLRQQILPMLETAGLITQEADSNDKRKILVYPLVPTTISEDQRNSGERGRVNNNDIF